MSSVVFSSFEVCARTSHKTARQRAPGDNFRFANHRLRMYDARTALLRVTRHMTIWISAVTSWLARLRAAAAPLEISLDNAS